MILGRRLLMSYGARLLLLAIVHFVSNSSAAQVQTLTLADVIRIGHENNRALKISATKVDAASAKASEAMTSLLPSLKLSASYQRLSDVPPFAVTLPSSIPPPIGGSTFTLAPTVLNNYQARVSLQQPIFTGFKLESNIRAANYLAEASEFENKNDKADLTLAITTAYWTLYQTIETKKFIDENVLRLQTAENDTKNLLKAGVATRNDLLKVQLQLNNAKLTQIDATNDVQIAMMNLNNVIGKPLDTQVQLSSQPGIPLEQEGEPSIIGERADEQRSYLAKALDTRGDVKAMQSRVEASRAGVSAAQGGWWPQLFLTGGYTYARPNQRYQPTKDEFKGTWDVGVQLQFDIWNWGVAGHQSEQAKAALQQSELTYEQLKENVAFDVKRQSLALQRSREKVGVAMLAIEQADENERISNDKYKQGLATSTELLDATVALLQAKTSYSGALVEHEIARARLNRAIGVVE